VPVCVREATMPPRPAVFPKATPGLAPWSFRPISSVGHASFVST
jgi:hypothetical protein